MKLTNIYNLPQPLVDAVKNDPYSKGDADYSITQLIESPRVAELERRHDHELTEDVSDRLHALEGQIMHGILERAEVEAFAEKRYFMQIDKWRVSGAVDRHLLIKGLLQDYKRTSVWKVRKGVPEDFESQVNCYIELLRYNGFEIRQAEIVAMLRDWHKGQVARQVNYPITQAVIMPVRIWDREITREFILDRILAHEEARVKLPKCTPTDMWQDPTEYAVMQTGRKYAVRLYLSEKDALEHIKIGGPSYYLEVRKKEPKRCADGYCLAANFCTQWQELKAAQSQT
jgi:hypothetical protein